MKLKQYQVLFGLFALIAILGAASETTIMTASAQSVLPGRHCTTSQPCVQVCGDHVCAAGELAQMKTQSVQTQRNINNATSATTSPITTPTTGVIIAGVVSYMDVASDGTAVVIRTGHPISGQPLAIGIVFKDANENFVKHQNYAITVAQDNQTVFSNPTGHTHTGIDSLTTSALSSNHPVDIVVTLNGVGLPTADPSTWTGVKGVVLDFSKVLDVQAPTPTAPIANMTNTTSTAVPEFGSTVSIILAIAVLSMVVFAAKTRVIPRL
jgi:hypothetical protein